MRKLVVTLGVVAALMLVFGGSASAGTYPGDATLTCTPSTVAIGDNLSCTATGYEPGATVTFEIGSGVLGSAVADANGVASITAPVPTGTPTGAVTVTSTGTGAGGGTTALVLNTNVTVHAAALQPVEASQLPATGSDSSLPIAQIAVVLIAAGGLAVLVARRRSNKPTEVSV